MEIFILFAIIGIINSVIKNAKRQGGNAKGGAGTAPEQPWRKMMGSFTDALEKMEQDGKKLSYPPKVGSTGVDSMQKIPAASMEKSQKWWPATSSQGERSGRLAVEQAGISEGISLEGRAGGIVEGSAESFGSRMESRLTESWLEADAQSMGDRSLLMTETITEGSEIKLQFTKDSLLQAVVMNEILTRPCNRRRLGGYR